MNECRCYVQAKLFNSQLRRSF